MTCSVTVVNIAAGDPDLLNVATVSALRGNGCLVLRTARSPWPPGWIGKRFLFPPWMISMKRRRISISCPRR